MGERVELRTPPVLVPRADAGVPEVGVLEAIDGRHVQRALIARMRPRPRAAHHRRPSAGADATPTTMSPSCSSAMSVPQIGSPRTNDAVPSIGSRIHLELDVGSPIRPSSSPSTA